MPVFGQHAEGTSINGSAVRAVLGTHGSPPAELLLSQKVFLILL